jgi:hypothetical protein
VTLTLTFKKVHNSQAQGQVAAPGLPICLPAWNSWEQGQITQADPLLFVLFFFFSFSLSLNSLLPELVKLKHNAENGRDL